MKVPPPVDKDHWQGLFAQVVMPADQPSGNWLVDLLFCPKEFSLTSPGWVTPNTFPFEDCFMDTCTNKSV